MINMKRVKKVGIGTKDDGVFSKSDFQTPEEVKNDETTGYSLIKEWVTAYPISSNPTINDEMIEKLARGLRLMNFNYVVLPEDETRCSLCNFVTGKTGMYDLAYHTKFGNSREPCVYCGIVGLYDTIMEHNMGDCDCPEQDERHSYWSRQDCLIFYDSFKDKYLRILSELENENDT